MERTKICWWLLLIRKDLHIFTIKFFIHGLVFEIPMTYTLLVEVAET